MPHDIEAVRELYLRFADVEVQNYSPLLNRLSRFVANDELLLRFIGSMPDTQPNLFFASIQYVSGPGNVPTTASQLREFVWEHQAQLTELVRSRRTQTNEVGRCAVLLPALPAGPIALVEVGASAGLCLLLDLYRYDYGGTQVGDPSSAVILCCSPVGTLPIPVPRAIPSVTWRKGLDLRPVDVARADDSDWLVACVWPDHVERRERLKAALQIARAQAVPIEERDLTKDLERAVRGAPADSTLVVFHSAVLWYLSPDQRHEFVSQLVQISKRRDVVWISNEGLNVLPSLDASAPPRPELKFRLGRTILSQGQKESELLALGHYHGLDLEWLAT